MSKTTINPKLEIQETIDEYQLTNIDEENIKEISENTQKNTQTETSEEKIFNKIIDTITPKIEKEPQYKKLTAGIFLKKYYKQLTNTTKPDKEIYKKTFKGNLKKAIKQDIADQKLLNYNIEELAEYIKPERDKKFDYMALTTLYQRYFLKDRNKNQLELPQAFWMRIAMGIALAEKENKQKWAKKFYDKLSKLEFIHSTPTLFHSGTTHSQLSSCYVTTIKDSLDHIFKSYWDHAKLSKWSGGLGNDWTNLRAEGAKIKTTNVESTGPIPFLKISNDVTAAINRSGKRRGAACAYMECWHLDFPEFIDLRRRTGDERRRTHDMNIAAWIPDLFMKRVRNNEKWTLFSPDEVPELHHIYGKEFEEKYKEYERKAKNGEIEIYERIDAKNLWKEILTRLYETGHPWITFKDPCNIRNPQNHDGVIHSSNLCTEITLNTSEDEIAVCNLGSVNLAKHVDENGLKEEKLQDTIETAVRMLDNTIDLNYYPIEEAKRSNQKHRPIGLGVMGFHESLLKQDISFNSEKAVEFADKSQEQIAYNAIMSSSKLVKERGTYETYTDSKWDRNILPQDSFEQLEQERGIDIPVERTERLDWSEVRESIDVYGMRNSNVMAIAPTATISTIAGTTPSIEPIYSNLYVKSNMSGDFTIVNDYLVEDLKEKDLWVDELIEKIKYHDGSIQEIEEISEEIKEKHRGAFEIDPRHQLRLTARRTRWIDQAISHNIFFPSDDGEFLSDVYQTAWKMGLKTTYYLRTLAKSSIEKSTVDPDDYEGKTQIRR